MKKICILLSCVAALWMSLNPLCPMQAEEKVAAVVNGEQVLEKEVEKKLSRFKDIDPSLLSDTRQDILEEIIAQRLVEQFIRKEKIKVEDAAVEKTLESIRNRLQADPRAATFTLEELLESTGSSLEELRKDIRNSMGLKAYIGRTVDENILRKYFLENKDFYGGETVKASHILVDTRALKTPEELDKARKEIEDIKRQLDKGADFAELARKYSDCPSSEQGGDIGFFPRHGAVVEAFAEAAFGLKVGETSEPVQTEFGYHIIKVTDRKAGREVKFEEVRQQVEGNYVENEIAKLLTRLKEEAQIEIIK